MSDVTPSSDGAAIGRKLLNASVLMAGGTLASRLLGLVRNSLAAAVLSSDKAQADIFTIAITVPTQLYYLFAGGTLNTVFVPQIARAIENDEDNGQTYVNRLMTLFGIGTLIVTVLAMVAVRPLAWIMSNERYHTPEMAPQFDNIVFLTLLMLPQVFLWGAFFLIGQVLNALDRFGPMAWAPVLNNVVQVLMFAFYGLIYGYAGDHSGPFSHNQMLILATGTGIGIGAQAVLLAFYLRKAGFGYRPRFDFRGTGLGKVLHLAKWVLAGVVVSQLVTAVINRIAMSGTATTEGGAGLFAYTQTMLIWMMPHGLITVSLMTAVLPTISRLADAGDLDGVRREMMRALRVTATIMVPCALALAILSHPIATLIFGYGAGASGVGGIAWTLVGYCVGLPMFTAVYVITRAFYALEDTRTSFLLNLVYDVANIALAVVLVYPFHRPAWVAPALALAYSLAHLPALPLYFRAVQRYVPGISLRETVLHWGRVALATLPAAVAAWLITWAAHRFSTGRIASAVALVVAGVVGLVLFFVVARLMRIGEVADIVRLVGDRLPGRRAALVEDDAIATVLAHDAAAPLPGVVAELDDHDVTETRTWHVSEEHEPAVEPTRAFPTTPAPRRAIVPEDPRDLLDPEDDDELDTAIDREYQARVSVGQMLAGRYRLEEHLATRGRTQTWQAFDEVLSRAVLVHAMAPHDPHADDVLAAARRAAIATDSRFLRVLDAVHSTDDEIGSHIVNEFVPGSSLEVLLRDGSLSALESGWIVREVADALSLMHSQGLYHGRLDLDTVVISTMGNVKIVGFLTEAALHPEPGEDELSEAELAERDVEALGKILYALLVARWPGGPRYGLPAAPSDGTRWLTPRQVRAGVSPALDVVCDRILSRPPRNRELPLRSAHDIMIALTRILGSADASADLERRMRQPVLPGSASSAGSGTSAGSLNSALTRPSAEPLADRTVVLPAVSGATAVDADAPFTPVPAPAPAAPLAQVRRRDRGRPLMVFLFGLIVVSLVVGLVGVLVRLSHPDKPNVGAPSLATSAPAAPLVTRPIAAAKDFDPEGSKTEMPGQIGLAIDGDPATAWHTERYPAARPATLQGVTKSGVGLILDLGSPQQVSKVTPQLVGQPAGIEIRVADPAATTPPMDAIKSWTRVAGNDAAGTTPELVFAPVTTRYVLVWFTTLPADGTGGFQAGIAEVQVQG